MINIKKAVQDYVLEQREPSGKLYCSALGGCILQEMYRFHNISKTHPHPELLLWKFKRYTWYEWLIQEALDMETLATQVVVRNDMWSGRIDMLIPEWNRGLIPERNQRFPMALPLYHLAEIKTISPWAPRGDMPYDHHKFQTWCYYVLYPHQDRIASVQLVYFDRWSTKLPQIRQYDISPSQTDITKTKAEMTRFETWTRREELPPKPYEDILDTESGAWRCAVHLYDRSQKRHRWDIRCQWFGICWPNYVNDKGEFVAHEQYPF